MSGCTATTENKNATNAKPAEPCDSSEAKCPLETARLVSVEYLDGSDDKELGTNGKHWVNLPRDEKWVDGTHVHNIDRLTQTPRVKVRFDKPGQHQFTLRHLPDSNNVAYTDSERGRNNKFKFQDQTKSYTTDEDGTKIVPEDYFVTAAGTHKYQVEAEDELGNKAKTKTIETHRLVHYIEIKMNDISAADDLSVFEGEFAKHHITLVELPEATIDRIPNIGSQAETATFQNACRAAYNATAAPEKQPYVVAVGYTDHLAVKNANQRLRSGAGTEVGPGKPAVEIPVRGAGLRAGDGVKDRYLWQGIVPNEGWFVSAVFRATNGSETNIAADKCTAVPMGNPNMSRTVRVDVSGLTSGTGQIILQVNWVDRMRAGLAFQDGNLICVCTRAWWREQSEQRQNEVMIHEMGHKVNMVADGTGSGPDKVSTHYAGKGHVGNHCHHDLPVRATYAGASGSKCVMFGSTNGRSAFCQNCVPAVRKQDLSAGWSGF